MRSSRAFHKLGGEIRYDCGVVDLIVEDGRVAGVRTQNEAGETEDLQARAVILGCGGFESNAELRTRFIGKDWAKAKVRGTPHNTGTGPGDGVQARRPEATGSTRAATPRPWTCTRRTTATSTCLISSASTIARSATSWA